MAILRRNSDKRILARPHNAHVVAILSHPHQHNCISVRVANRQNKKPSIFFVLPKTASNAHLKVQCATGLLYRYCKITATCAGTVIDENHTGDETFNSDAMTVSIPADVNVDGTVNIFDAIPLAEAHGSTVKRSNLESKRCPQR